MDLTGEYRIPAARERVWAALNDPDILRQCIPGCESLDQKAGGEEFTAAVMAKVGPVKARFTGKVKLSEIDPPNGYTISGEGSGGVAGFAKGGAKVGLQDDGGATVLSYTAHAQVGGKLAQIGSRLIDATARKMADEFFGKFSELLGGSGKAEPAVEAPEPTPAAAEAPRSPVPGLKLSSGFWLGAAIGAMVGILAYWLLG
ncbi:MAG: carbon monoxide dehydrogenase [Azospirillum sp.]|nr:carbon monoxide dehydrogenase [Azospirillum sp.]